MINKNNADIKMLMQLSNIQQKEIAHYLHVDTSTLCRRLQKELSPENRSEIMIAIREISIKRVEA